MVRIPFEFARWVLRDWMRALNFGIAICIFVWMYVSYLQEERHNRLLLDANANQLRVILEEITRSANAQEASLHTQVIRLEEVGAMNRALIKDEFELARITMQDVTKQRNKAVMLVLRKLGIPEDEIEELFRTPDDSQGYPKR
jgi:hypothetical protein